MASVPYQTTELTGRKINAEDSQSSYRGYRFPPEIISHAVWLYHRFTLSFRDIEELLVEVNHLASSVRKYDKDVQDFKVDRGNHEEVDHVIVFNERHLTRILSSYFDYYHRWRTHLGLAMDTPQGREIQMPDMGKVIEFADLGGLHHHYLRHAA